MTKDPVKRFKMAMVRFVFHLFNGLFKILPYPLLKLITRPLLSITMLVVKRMRKHAMETLNLAFGQEKSPEELKKICDECFYNLGKGFIELSYCITHPKMYLKTMKFRGNSQELLDAALKEGKGVVAVTAHFGNFSQMFAYLAQRGYPTNAIMRPSRDEKLEVQLTKLRNEAGLKTIFTIPRNACVAQSLRALRANEIVIVPMDQNNGSKAGVFVEFFGRPSGTASGPAIFAMRTGSPILPIFTVRTGEDTHEIIVEPHFYLEKKATDEETVQFNIQKITSIIERYVRQYPQEWGWMHRRWKSQPKEASLSIASLNAQASSIKEDLQ